MDAGDRISVTLRPAISIKLDNWERRRLAMQNVCSDCHAAGWVKNFYEQYDATVDLSNEKFAKPAKSIMDKLYAAKKLTPTPLDERIEWTYYAFWYHQGRRARMSTAMMGPDYTQWAWLFRSRQKLLHRVHSRSRTAHARRERRYHEVGLPQMNRRSFQGRTPAANRLLQKAL